MDKYKKLAMGVLKAVQKSSTNKLEKDLLGVVIKVESEKPQPGQAEQVAIGAPEMREAAAIPEPVKLAELQAPAPAPEAPQPEQIAAQEAQPVAEPQPVAPAAEPQAAPQPEEQKPIEEEKKPEQPPEG